MIKIVVQSAVEDDDLAVRRIGTIRSSEISLCLNIRELLPPHYRHRDLNHFKLLRNI